MFPHRIRMTCFRLELQSHLSVSDSSRLWDKGGAWSPKNIFFRPFRPHFGLKIRAGPGPLGPSPGSTTVLYCCKPPGKQHTNLWASCGFLGVPSLFRHYNLDLCLSGWFLASMSRGVIITLFHIIPPSLHHSNCTKFSALLCIQTDTEYFCMTVVNCVKPWPK